MFVSISFNPTPCDDSQCLWARIWVHESQPCVCRGPVSFFAVRAPSAESAPSTRAKPAGRLAGRVASRVPSQHRQALPCIPCTGLRRWAPPTAHHAAMDGRWVGLGQRSTRRRRSGDGWVMFEVVRCVEHTIHTIIDHLTSCSFYILLPL